MARDKLTEHFHHQLKNAGLTRLPFQEERQWISRYLPTISSYLMGSLNEVDDATKSSIHVSCLAVAKSENAYHALIGFEDKSQLFAYSPSVRSPLVQLSPGSYSGQLVRIPIQATPETLRTLLGGTGSIVAPLIEGLYIEPQSLRFEARRFATGDLSGLVGGIFLSEVEAQAGAAQGRWEIAVGVPVDETLCHYAFSCSSKRLGHLLFEVGLDQLTGELFGQLSRPLPKHPNISIAEGPLTHPHEQATQLTGRNLLQLGYTPVNFIDHTDADSDPGPLARDLRAVWKNWNPGYRWSLHLSGCY
ncbi:MAG: hypothetical protein EBZ48_17155, partial [Proteobacteria bacterium]|nr:hypothetical protein [Pseudomonadota bacterium]